jgi:hypothetical protein
VEKPESFSPFGFTIIDVEREIEEELILKISKSQELIATSIQKAFESIETNSKGSFLFPQFLQHRNVLLQMCVGTGGRIGFLIEKNNSRYFSLSISHDHELGIIIHYQMPISVKSSDVTISKFKDKWDNSFSDKGFIKDYF